MGAYSLPSVEEVRYALGFVPADDRDLWLKICFAIKSLFPDDVGLSLFDEWSSKASNYDTKAVRDTWKHAKNTGKVNHSSIFYEARQYGFTGFSGGGAGSSAYKPLSQEEQAKQAKERAEQQVRLPDVMADAGANMGLFEHLHGKESPREFADFLKANARKYYGAVGRAFIAGLVEQLETIESVLKSSIASLLSIWLGKSVSGQVERVASRFALVAVAGEMATAWGLTGWDKNEAINGVYACFKSWLDNRGGVGDLEEMAIIQQVRQFISEHGDSRFQWIHRANDTHAPRVINRAGYRLWVAEDGTRVNNKTDYYLEYGEEKPPSLEKSTCEYFVLADVFKNEICKGFDYKMAQRVLHEKGYLRVSKEGDKVRYTRKERVPAVGGVRVYCILPTILEGED